MKGRARQGIGVDVNQANLTTQEQEDYLWENGFLGSENQSSVAQWLEHRGFKSHLGLGFFLSSPNI